MGDSKSTMLLGRIAGAYGIKGWVKVSSYTEPAENIFKYSPWKLQRVDGADVTPSLEVVQGKQHGKGLIVQLNGVTDRDQAESLRGLGIHVDRESMPEPELDQYYWSDLEGLQVANVSGDELGRVDQLLDTGSADVMVVKGSERILIPFIVGQTVISVDLAAGRILVDWDTVEDAAE
ncbi:MAG: ribosome maturation factor RimM [Gammaproteobacteria bacterium]